MEDHITGTGVYLTLSGRKSTTHLISTTSAATLGTFTITDGTLK